MNKYKFLLLVLLFLLILGLNGVKASVHDLPLLGKVIYVDPGQECF